jgi:thiamine-phosphate diphosphorylase
MFADYPILCMVTSGRLSLQSSHEEIAAWLLRIGAAAQAGVTIVQIREPHLDARTACDLTTAALRVSAGTLTHVIVNDRLDVALASGAHGIHLKEHSIAAARVRAVAPRPFIVGQSTHDPEATGGADCDYVIFGTVFATSSKPGMASGTAALRRAVARAGVPVLAIGGVTEARLPEIRAAGAAGFAAIGFFHDIDVSELRARCGRARRLFDTPNHLS